MFNEATQQKVIEFINLIQSIEFWVDGGWGVDALLERQTRKHSDFDIIINVQSLVRLEQILNENDFDRTNFEEGTVYISKIGLKIDIHPIQFNKSGYGFFDIGNGKKWPFPPSAFRGEGYIGSKHVMCLSPEAQVQCHAQGYRPKEKDINDMQALQEKFGVVLPLSLCNTLNINNA